MADTRKADRRRAFLLYGAVGVITAAWLYAEFHDDPRVATARAWLRAKAQGCSGCQRRKETLARMFSQAQEAVNWGRDLPNDVGPSVD